MLKSFSATNTSHLEKKVRKYLSNFPDMKVVHWKLTAKYLKLERMVKLILRIEFAD